MPASRDRRSRTPWLLAALAAGLPVAALTSQVRPGAAADDEARRRAPQAGAPEHAAGDAALPEGIAAAFGEERITMDEYRDYLVRISGRRPLLDLVYERILVREAAAHGISVAEELLDEEEQQLWETLALRHRGDVAAMERELLAEGFTRESYGAVFRQRKRRELLSRDLAIATREVTEDKLREAFERAYGVGGVRVEVRHIFLNLASARRELQQEGLEAAALTQAKVRERVLTNAAALLAELERDADFEALAKRESDDISVHQNGGVIPNYNYRRYGEAFAQAVRAAEVGVPSGPVESPTGVHVFEVLSRTTTTLEDVRAKVEEIVRKAPPTGIELRDLEHALRARYPVRTF